MKLDRLLSIVLVLLERDRISASKLAEMFEVTKRTIFRDIEAINQAGIPIVTYPGTHGGIGIMQAYKIEKKLFTLHDLTALLTGLSSLNQTLPSQALPNTIAKVKGLIPEERMQEIERQSGQISFDPLPWFGGGKLALLLSDIRTALAEHRLLSFHYSNREGEEGRRIVEPYRLVFKESNWYLQAYCTVRADFRVFKLARISDIVVQSGIFEPRPFTASPLTQPENKLITITLRADASLRTFMEDFCGEEQVSEDGEGRLLVRFPFQDHDFGYAMLLRLGTTCECIEPEHVRAEMRRRLAELSKIYKK